MPEERRKNQCECGSKIFYKEGEYIFCASINCNNKWEAKREEDKTKPSWNELKKLWE